MGGLNAKVNKRKAAEETIMGGFEVGERNRRGDMLIEFAAEQQPVTCTDQYSLHRDKNRYWTWESSNGATNQIDKEESLKTLKTLHR